MKKQFYPTLEELLFENRNKAYGAYILRNTGDQTLLKSLFISSSALLILVAGIYLINKNSDEINFKTTEDKIVNIDVVDFPPEKKIEEVKPPEEVQPKQEKRLQLDTEQAKHILPDPKKEVIEQATIQNINDLKEKDLGYEDREGSQKSTNQVGGGEVNETGKTDVTGAQNVKTIPEGKPIDTKPERIRATQAKVMAVYPGCEKEISKGNDALTKCMSDRLSRDLSDELQNFGSIAERQNIQKAMAKMQFVVNTNGEITSIKPLSGSQKELSVESQKALERINQRMVRRGKTIQAAQSQNGQNANLIFSIPVNFQLQ